MTREYEEKPAAWMDERADPEGHSECGQGRKGRAAEKLRDNRPRLFAPAKVMLGFRFHPSHLVLSAAPRTDGSVIMTEDVRQSAQGTDLIPQESDSELGRGGHCSPVGAGIP